MAHFIGDPTPSDEASLSKLRSAVTKFVSDLLVVETTTLNEDDQKTCHMCKELFIANNDNEPPKEQAVRLPCGHVFGKECMSLWLTSNEIRSPKTCPMCRAELLPAFEPGPAPMDPSLVFAMMHWN